MTGFIITALVFTVLWLLAALAETENDRRIAADDAVAWKQSALYCAKDANDAHVKLAAALRSLQAVEEAQRHVHAGYVVVEADGRQIVLFRN